MARASVVLAEEIMTTEQDRYFRRLKHFFIKRLFDQNYLQFKRSRPYSSENGEKDMVLKIGEAAPEFELETSEGDMFRLSDLDGQWKVVFFFAKSGSPTCKRGCLSFKEQYELFQSLEPSVEVIGISQDTVQQHKKFKKELDLPFPLLSDQERNVAEKFGVPLHLGLFPSKSSFVIGPDNTVHHVYDWLFRPRKHVAQIISALDGDGGQ